MTIEELEALSNRMFDHAESTMRRDAAADFRKAATAVGALATLKSRLPEIADRCIERDTDEQIRDLLADIDEVLK